MMSISKFAISTGLNAKTLRFYDERGLLTPAEVDPVSGYRRYAASQLRDATTIRVLRAAGMSLDQVAEALAEPDRLEQLVAEHQNRLAAERAMQDRAIALAKKLLPDLEPAAEPQTRHADACHWVAAAYTIQLDGIEDQDDPVAAEAENILGTLHEALAAAGNPPVGTYWTSMPADGTGTTMEVLLAFPVATPVPASFSIEGLDVRRGTLPARTEAYLELRPEDLDEDLLDDLPGGRITDPHLIAFSEYLESVGAEPSDLRQTSSGTGPDDWSMVYCTTISED